jgi:hypothetical protein
VGSLDSKKPGEYLILYLTVREPWWATGIAKGSIRNSVH